MQRWIVTGLMLTLAAGSAAADTDGKAVYDKQCASCHGADGHGNASKSKILKIDAAMLDLGRDEAKVASRDEKKKILLEGKGKMPAYAKKLAPAEVDPVLDHALGLVAGGKSVAAPPAAAPPAAPITGASATAATYDAAKAKAAWKKSCASCHGPEGRGVPAKAKALKLDATTLDLAREAAAGLSRAEKRTILADGKSKMPAYQKKLTAAKLDMLTDYSVDLAKAGAAKK